MPLVRSSRREAVAAVTRSTAGLLALTALVACARGDSELPTGAGDVAGAPSSAGRMGYLLEVDTRRRSVRVGAPGAQAASSANGPSFSILDGSAIGIGVDNYTISDLGAFVPGKVRVRFDVSVSNRLPGVSLVPSALGGSSTAGGSLMLFPLLQRAGVTTGPTASSDDGLVLVTPRGTEAVVAPSADWDGDGTGSAQDGFDFGADTACTVPAPGCTRWEAVPPLASGATSAPRTVGFDLDPTVSGFRVWLLLVADLQSDTTTIPPPPPPPGQGFPFGPFSLLNPRLTGDDPAARGDGPFSLTHDGYSADNVIYRVVSARANGLKLILAMTGGPHTDYMTDSVFDRAKWEAKLQTYNTPAIREVIAEGVADGTIVGASVMDEPHVSGGSDGVGGFGNTWGPRGTMTKARVDSLCHDVKAVFPTLPVGVEHQHTLFEPDKSYHECDWLETQYSAFLGSVEDFRASALALGRRDGHGIMFSLNILNGGPQAPRDGLWNCPPTSGGRGQYEPNCRMTPQQVLEWGEALGPAGCGGLLMWRYDSTFMASPDNQRAFRELATRFATLPQRPCTRR